MKNKMKKEKYVIICNVTQSRKLKGSQDELVIERYKRGPVTRKTAASYYMWKTLDNIVKKSLLEQHRRAGLMAKYLINNSSLKQNEKEN
jgi:hypothetical protein